jgi:hypothetical protein
MAKKKDQMKIVVKGYFEHLFPKHLLPKLKLDTLAVNNTSYYCERLKNLFL